METPGIAGVNVIFEVNGKQDMTGKGDAFRILATVLMTIRDFMEIRPDVTRLEFEVHMDQPSKKRVYDRMIDRYATGFHVSTSTWSKPYVIYKLTRE